MGMSRTMKLIAKRTRNKNWEKFNVNLNTKSLQIAKEQALNSPKSSIVRIFVLLKSVTGYQKLKRLNIFDIDSKKLHVC